MITNTDTTSNIIGARYVSLTSNIIYGYGLV